MTSLFKSGSKLHWIKNLYLRYRNGAGCCDVFDADVYLEGKILPVLKEFRKRINSWPCDLDDFGQWETILDEMIWAFEYEEDLDRPFDFEWKQKESNRQQFGFELFGMYFRHLWI